MSNLGGEQLEQITQLLKRWSEGESEALSQATELIYAELRKIAEAYLRRERSDHTLQPTALIHEAYLRMADLNPKGFDSRKQFLALAARLMRQILVDHARQAKTAKRGGGVPKVPVQEALDYAPDHAQQFLVLDDALSRLAKLNPRKAEVLELRYFGGLNVEEVGEVLGISAATVSREQRMAEAWLGQELATS